MDIKRISISLQSEDKYIPVDAFKTAVDELTTMLHEVEIEISEARRSKLQWNITELSLGSATIGLEAISTEDLELAAKTESAVVEGLCSLRESNKRPQYFNDTALESARRLARIRTDGISRINVFSNVPNQQLYITEEISVNVGTILENMEFIGSVEGILELLSGREGQPLYFRVRDIVTGASVRCYFPEEMLEQALAHFRKRVIVSGLILVDNSGRPRQIRIKEIETVPGVTNLPQPEDVGGLLKDIDLRKFADDF